MLLPKKKFAPKHSTNCVKIDVAFKLKWPAALNKICTIVGRNCFSYASSSRLQPRQSLGNPELGTSVATRLARLFYNKGVTKLGVRKSQKTE